jgi:Trypsin
MRYVSKVVVVGLIACVGCGTEIEGGVGYDEAAPASGTLSALDTTHTNAGALVRRRADGVLRQLCSGILIAPSVFLTAGHCTEAVKEYAAVGEPVYVTFDQVISDAGTLLTATPVTSPAYSQSHYNINSDSHDLGVMLLDEPVTHLTPASLPTANLVGASRPAPGTPITAVGYGLNQNGASGGKAVLTSSLSRNRGTLKYRSATAFILADQIKADGVCFGDSGGPDFMTFNGVEQLVAVSVVGNSYDCNEVGWLYRLDTPDSRAFLGAYAPLP